MTFDQDGHFALRDLSAIAGADQFKYEMMLYEAAIHLMNAKLQVLQEEFLCLTDRTPIDHYSTRLKSPESIVEKMERKGHPMTLQSMKENIRDIAGVRIVCPFLSDVYAVARILMQQDDVHVIKTKDYIRKPKSCGYRSLHILLTVDVHLSSCVREVPVELQIRTIAMNCWAGVEHQIRYKKDLDSAVADAVLLQCARLMTEADTNIQKLVNTIPGMRDDFGTITGDPWENQGKD